MNYSNYSYLRIIKTIVIGILFTNLGFFQVPLINHSEIGVFCEPQLNAFSGPLVVTPPPRPAVGS